MGAALFAKLCSYFKWYYSIGGKFFKKAWGITSTLVVASFLSQVFVILASLLPLKVIMLISSQRVPSYFPSVLAGFEQSFLVAMLGGASVFFYFGHLLLEKFLVSFSTKAAEKILSANEKVLLFENQNDIACNGYLRYVRSLGGGIFILLISWVLALIYPVLLLVLLLYAGGSFWVVSYLVGRRADFDSSQIAKFIKICSSVGFLLVFFSILFLFFTGRAESPLAAIVALISARQLSGKVTSAANDMLWLKCQKNRLNVLFFHGHVLVPEQKSEKAGFWTRIEEATLSQVVSQVDPCFGIKKNCYSNISYTQSGLSDVVTFTALSGGGERSIDEKRYLIKVFNVNRERWGVHESTLLTELSNLPSPAFLSVSEFDGFRFHLFDITSWRSVSPKEGRLCVWRIVAKLMEVEPSDFIRSSYTRSRQMMWQQINGDLYSRLRLGIVGASNYEREQLEKLFAYREAISRKLNSLPLVLVNPDLRFSSILTSGKNNYASTHWGRWALEPIGAGWPLEDWAICNLEEALELARSRRSELAGVDYRDVRLSAFLYGFLTHCQRQSFRYALDLLPEIIDCLDVSVKDVVATQ